MSDSEGKKDIIDTTNRLRSIEVGIAVEKQDYYDFGNFESKYKIKMDRKKWIKYIEARRDFEILHSELIKQARKKYKFK